jgi:hypothetical protein
VASADRDTEGARAPPNERVEEVYMGGVVLRIGHWLNAAQFRWRLGGSFKGAPKPSHATPERRLGALQQS